MRRNSSTARFILGGDWLGLGLAVNFLEKKCQYKRAYFGKSSLTSFIELLIRNFCLPYLAQSNNVLEMNFKNRQPLLLNAFVWMRRRLGECETYEINYGLETVNVKGSCDVRLKTFVC